MAFIRSFILIPDIPYILPEYLNYYSLHYIHMDTQSNISKQAEFRLVVFQTRPLAQFLRVSVLVTQITHSTTVVGAWPGRARRGRRESLQSDEGVDEGV